MLRKANKFADVLEQSHYQETVQSNLRVQSHYEGSLANPESTLEPPRGLEAQDSSNEYLAL